MLVWVFVLVIIWFILCHRQLSNVQFGIMFIFLSFYLIEVTGLIGKENNINRFGIGEFFVNSNESNVKAKANPNNTKEAKEIEESCPAIWTMSSKGIVDWLSLPQKMSNMFTFEISQLSTSMKGVKDPDGNYVEDESLDFKDTFAHLNNEYFVIDKTLRDLSILNPRLYKKLIYGK